MQICDNCQQEVKDINEHWGANMWMCVTPADTPGGAWESVDYDGKMERWTYRMRVPGGWLYQYREKGYRALVFVPEPAVGGVPRGDTLYWPVPADKIAPLLAEAGGVEAGLKGMTHLIPYSVDGGGDGDSCLQAIDEAMQWVAEARRILGGAP